jgi:hypothetical protein
MEESNNLPPSSDPTAATAKPLSPLQRFMGMFTSPLAALQDVAARPDWITPMTILVVTTVIFTYLMMPAILADAAKNIDKMVDTGKLTVEQGEKAQAASQGFTRMFAPFMGALFVLISSAAAAAILLFVGNVIMAGKSNFRQIFSIFLWSGMVGLIGSILRVPMALKQNTMSVYFSPAAFFAEEAHESTLYRISAALDVFILWRVILIAIGFAVIYRFSVGKSLGIILGLYALLVVVSVSFAGLF